MHPSTNINQLMFSLSHPSIPISHRRLPHGVRRGVSGSKIWVRSSSNSRLPRLKGLVSMGNLIFGRDYLNERPNDSQRIESVFPFFEDPDTSRYVHCNPHSPPHSEFYMSRRYGRLTRSWEIGSWSWTSWPMSSSHCSAPFGQSSCQVGLDEVCLSRSKKLEVEQLQKSCWIWCWI